jgi:riboflavin synthase
VNKGYIALDGMSITVIEVINDTFTITLIPHTKKTTVAIDYQINTKINIEFDILSKYVENLMRTSQ